MLHRFRDIWYSLKILTTAVRWMKLSIYKSIEDRKITADHNLKRFYFIYGFRNFWSWLTRWFFWLADVSFYYKILWNKNPGHLYEKIRFNTDIHSINVRRRDRMFYPWHRTSVYEKSVQLQPSLMLQLSVRLRNNLNKFKKCMRN